MSEAHINYVRSAKSSPSHPAPAFWKMAYQLSKLGETERVYKIKAGFQVNWAEATKVAFNLTTPGMVSLLNVSPSTYARLRSGNKQLDAVASERLDRVVGVALLAENVFEDKTAATQWMSTPNAALGGVSPIMHCDTEIGARQVRRILNALEWGGVV
tara:strand:+ start:2741 stop:3211 length:471 start_codon:yes stop_codon:yes gene_type:complete